MKNNILFLVLTAFIATGCTTSGSSVGDMAIGSDSAAIKAGRNRKEARATVSRRVGTTPPSTC